jgi:hypothetical protein
MQDLCGAPDNGSAQRLQNALRTIRCERNSPVHVHVHMGLGAAALGSSLLPCACDARVRQDLDSVYTYMYGVRRMQHVLPEGA